MSAEKPLIRLFTTPICPYCPAAEKMMNQVLPELGERVKFEKVNVWSSKGREEGKKLNVMTVPAIAVDEEIIFRVVPKNIAELKNKINDAIKR